MKKEKSIHQINFNARNELTKSEMFKVRGGDDPPPPPPPPPPPEGEDD